MNGASLELYRSDYGCCNTLLAEWNDPLGSYVEALPFSPQLLYIHPQAETVKHRSLSGSAFIDFPVDKTVIYPEYRRIHTNSVKYRPLLIQSVMTRM